MPYAVIVAVIVGVIVGILLYKRTHAKDSEADSETTDKTFWGVEGVAVSAGVTILGVFLLFGGIIYSTTADSMSDKVWGIVMIVGSITLYLGRAYFLRR